MTTKTLPLPSDRNGRIVLTLEAYEDRLESSGRPKQNIHAAMRRLFPGLESGYYYPGSLSFRFKVTENTNS
ncbi:hypothetical protein Hypma_004720 [Hypsizygus marmoreus]|uniref:Uncharacterized protein n=1 Tax=Hypsizygus marmoreus TaxID=39966 RepID=A0A369J492_HYPMA|nr:hypothetical protein Hypma_004720 [Hypsizygus marmoreus]